MHSPRHGRPHRYICLGDSLLRGHRLRLAAAGAALLLARCPAAAAAAPADLNQLSLEELANIDITSVSKTPEKLSDAAAAVYVITHDDIVRSGATSIPEILRLAPNLQVAQISASSYAISARGFNGNVADKLLVLIDGRSVYTPLYGGVYWDEQDVPPEDIERIEVISGPGATLWGANAVNGVINIITRKAADTQGGVLDLGFGDRERRASLQYGGKLADDLAYRVYGEGFSERAGKLSNGAPADDGWSKPQGGFRLDWTPQHDTVTLQGDIYHGSEPVAGAPDTVLSGGNVQANWQHRFDNGSQVQLLTYFDQTDRYNSDHYGYALNTYDIELQHSFALDARNAIVWGAGFRAYQDHFSLPGGVYFQPPSSTKTLADVFAQDSVALTDTLTLTLGLKLEADPYTSLTPLPSVRLAWKANDKLLFWAAASRAVRAPTRFDTDLVDTVVPSVLILTGNRDFQPEKLTAYEIGTRVQPTAKTSLSVSAYYNVYNDLRTIEWLSQDTVPLLLTYGNMMQGVTYGIEVWGDWQVTDWWRLTAGFNLEHEALRFKAGSSDLGGISIAGNDPDRQASLRSTVNLAPNVTWQTDLRAVGSLPNPSVPGYVELDARLGWAVSKSLELSLSGFNLLHAHHVEYEEAGATVGGEVYRSVFAEAKWRF